jgi:hypothetical protein
MAQMVPPPIGGLGGFFDRRRAALLARSCLFIYAGAPANQLALRRTNPVFCPRIFHGFYRHVCVLFCWPVPAAAEKALQNRHFLSTNFIRFPRWRVNPGGWLGEPSPSVHSQKPNLR